MGENQGMLWIILGVVLVAGAVMLLGEAMKGGVDDATGDINTAITA